MPRRSELRTDRRANYDVVVCGGGAAGVAAAIGAARAGAHVARLEQAPFLGGAATRSGVLTGRRVGSDQRTRPRRAARAQRRDPRVPRRRSVRCARRAFARRCGTARPRTGLGLRRSGASGFASARVMGTAFATGHAAGVAAAQFAGSGTADVRTVRAELDGQHAILALEPQRSLSLP